MKNVIPRLSDLSTLFSFQYLMKIQLFFQWKTFIFTKYLMLLSQALAQDRHIISLNIDTSIDIQCSFMQILVIKFTDKGKHF